MKNLFAPADINHYRNEVHQKQTAYKEAIQMNKEFEEVRRIYDELKKSEKELQEAIQKNKESIN
jgi:uncharacterized protein (DUF111 family)